LPRLRIRVVIGNRILERFVELPAEVEKSGLELIQGYITGKLQQTDNTERVLDDILGDIRSLI